MKLNHAQLTQHYLDQYTLRKISGDRDAAEGARIVYEALTSLEMQLTAINRMVDKADEAEKKVRL